MWQGLRQWLASVVGAIVFYTYLPIPPSWPCSLDRVARFAPLVGLSIGFGLAFLDRWLWFLPPLSRAVMLVSLWLWVTGGLHLDGVMDTTDGLAVSDPRRRLEVMSDSRTGAYGVMAAILILVTKVAVLAELGQARFWAIILAMGWGRWGQALAIALYPYLRPTGKGSFHKQHFRSPQDLLWGLLPLGGLTLIQGNHWLQGLGRLSVCLALTWVVGAWLNHKLGGHTGDTYGAIVEVSEVLILVSFLQPIT